jgi:hypothetical protein
MLHSIDKNKSLKEQLLPMDIVKLRDGRIGVIFPNDNDTETGLAIFGQDGCINYLNHYDKNLKYARFNDANDIISICRAPKYCFSLIRDFFEYKSLEEIEKEYITWNIEINKEFTPTIEEGDFVLLRDKRICKVKVHKYNQEILNFVSIFDEDYIISDTNFYDNVWNNLTTCDNHEKYDVIAVKKCKNNDWMYEPIDNLIWDYKRDPDTGNWWRTIEESN